MRALKLIFLFTIMATLSSTCSEFERARFVTNGVIGDQQVRFTTNFPLSPTHIVAVQNAMTVGQNNTYDLRPLDALYRESFMYRHRGKLGFASGLFCGVVIASCVWAGLWPKRLFNP